MECSTGGAGGTASTSQWVVVATVLVMFMQAGFALLEIGFSRGKNVGHGVVKILANFSIATIAWWAVGFGIAFGGAGWLMGDDALFFSFGENISTGLVAGTVGGSTAAFMLFQFMFCAVSLAIVWGTTLERMKFSALRDLRDRVRCADLPARRALDLRRRLPAARSATACRTSPARRSCTWSAPPARSPRCCCSARGWASTAATASRASIPGTPCRSSASAC